MRLIPVIDVRGGLAVHAVAGQRTAYRPPQSVLTDSADPLVLASRFHGLLAAAELYVADLDAIESASASAGHAMGLSPAVAEVAAWAAGAGVTLLVDAGISAAPVAAALAGYAALRLVVGTETLNSLGDLQAIVAVVGADRVIASLDLRDGQVLTGTPELAGCTPEWAAALLTKQGVTELIVIDLARVGTGAGPRAPYLAALMRDLPDLSIVVGGGVRDSSDLAGLRQLGVAGALVATALHTGAITAGEWARYA